MSKLLSLLLAGSVLLLSACSYSKPDIIVPIHPDVPNTAAKTGQGQTISVNAIDQRKSNVIGNTSGMEAMAGNPVWIRTANDLTEVLKLKLNNEVLTHGFNTSSLSDTRQLTAALTNLTYTQRDAGVNSIHEFKAVIAVTAQNGTRTFQRVYNSEMSYKTPWVLKKAQFDEYVNNVLAIILKNISNDGELWQFLN